MHKKALIIANQEYMDSEFDDLPGASRDAQELANVLASKTVGEFDVDIVGECSEADIRKKIEAFFARASRDDLLLLHLSCHGRRDDRSRELYFVAKDTEHDYLASTGIAATFINERIQHCRSTRVILLLDCCYSGSYVRGLRSRAGQSKAISVAQHFQGQGRAIITACSALQFSYENQIWSSGQSEPSVFTASVVEGLRTGLADVDADGFVSVHDLYEYVHARVTEQIPEQTPEFSVDRLSGELYIARNIQSLYLGTASTPRIPINLYNAIFQGEPWQRFGATLALERLLDSTIREDKEAAREALIPLVRDPDPEISARAMSVWKSKILRFAPIPAGREAVTLADSEGFAAKRRAVGIDFGTTNSTIAVLEGGVPTVISNNLGVHLTPSVVGFSKKVMSWSET